MGLRLAHGLAILLRLLKLTNGNLPGAESILWMSSCIWH
jgi:hypothetical protein